MARDDESDAAHLTPAQREWFMSELRARSLAATGSSQPSAPTSRVEAHCSFCGRSRTEVNYLVTGPKLFVCDLCVSIFVGGTSPDRSSPGPVGQCSFCSTQLRGSRLAFKCGHPDFSDRIICARCIGVCVDVLAANLGGDWKRQQLLWPEASKYDD